MRGSERSNVGKTFHAARARAVRALKQRTLNRELRKREKKYRDPTDRSSSASGLERMRPLHAQIKERFKVWFVLSSRCSGSSRLCNARSASIPFRLYTGHLVDAGISIYNESIVVYRRIVMVGAFDLTYCRRFLTT